MTTSTSTKSSKKLATKKNSALEAREEKLHKDLDGDGERGESAAHRAKVLGFPKKLHPSGSKAKVIGKPTKSVKNAIK